MKRILLIILRLRLKSYKNNEKWYAKECNKNNWYSKQGISDLELTIKNLEKELSK